MHEPRNYGGERYEGGGYGRPIHPGVGYGDRNPGRGMYGDPRGYHGGRDIGRGGEHYGYYEREDRGKFAGMNQGRGHYGEGNPRVETYGRGENYGRGPNVASRNGYGGGYGRGYGRGKNSIENILGGFGS